MLVYYVIFFGLFVYFLFFMRAILCQHTVDSNTVMHGTSNLHCWCHIWLLEPAQGAMMAVHWQKHPLSWYKECKMHIFKTDNSANEIDMKRFMRAGNKEQSEILDFSLCFHCKTIIMSLISLIFLILHLKVIIYYNSQNAANNTTMFNINPFFSSQQIHSPLACFNDHLHCTSFVSFPYMRWPFWLRSGRQIILFTYLFSILLLFFL